ncbi:MAG: S4 domain-containing protein YaaA [Oscillospiraceae bacterium]|jgi:ribosome-associated protein|nr:S4 domain-containing protein YaaA [Oscillospiraceae bacterium]
MNAETVEISTENIKLDSFLKLAGRAATGGQAKIWIINGDILVNGDVCFERGRKLYDGDLIQIKTDKTAYVVKGKPRYKSE